jgi:hypothetical protein
MVVVGMFLVDWDVVPSWPFHTNYTKSVSVLTNEIKVWEQVEREKDTPPPIELKLDASATRMIPRSPASSSALYDMVTFMLWICYSLHQRAFRLFPLNILP